MDKNTREWHKLIIEAGRTGDISALKNFNKTGDYYKLAEGLLLNPLPARKENRHNFLKGLVLLENSMKLGSTSQFYKFMKRLDLYNDVELMDWILANRNNPYIPFGSYHPPLEVQSHPQYLEYDKRRKKHRKKMVALDMERSRLAKERKAKIREEHEARKKTNDEKRGHENGNPEVPCPSKREVEKYLKRWEQNGDLKETSENITKLFAETYPENNDIHAVWIKVQALNSAFNVNVPEIHKVAEHIININEREDISVETIRRGHGARSGGADKESDLYSFATKYCAFHEPEKYPIFDANVERSLRYFRENEDCDFQFGGNIRNYENFVSIIKRFKKHFNLDCSFRDIDKYLYLVGRELDLPGNKS